MYIRLIAMSRFSQNTRDRSIATPIILEISRISSASPVFVHPHLGRPDQLCGTFRREGFWVKQTVSCRVPYTTSFDPALLRMFSLPPGSPFSRDNDILQ